MFELKFSNIKNFLLTLLFANIALRIIKEFSDVNEVYYLNFQFFTDKGRFTEDLFHSSSIFFKSSIYYDIISFLQFDLDNHLYVFIYHCLILSITVILIFLIIKKLFKINENYLILFLIIILSTKSSVVLDLVVSNWVGNRAATASFLAHFLNFALLYFLVYQRTFGVIVISSINIFIAFKIAWFSSVVSIFYLIFFEKKYRKLLAIIPIGFILFLALKDFNYENLQNSLELYSFVLEREYFQVLFEYQKNTRLSLFILSFFLFFYINKKTVNKDSQKIMNLVLALQILVFLFYTIIDISNLDFLKRWQLLAMSPVRATAFYEFIFLLLLFNFLIDFTLLQKNDLKKIILILFIFFVGFGKNGTYISLFLLALFFIVNHFHSIVRINFDKKTIIFISLLIITPSLVYLTIKGFSNTIETKYFSEEKKIFMKDISHKKYLALRKIKKCKDFLFYDIDYNSLKSSKSNLIAMKSQFFIDATHLYGNLNLLRLNKKNRNLIKKLRNLYNEKNKKMDNSLVNDFIDSQVVLLINNRHTNKFNGIYDVLEINDAHSLVLINYEKEKITRGCNLI